MAFISVLLQIFWKKFHRNVSWVVLYQPNEFCPNRWFWLVPMASEKLNFRKKYSKIFFPEAIRGMKLKLCINVHDISLYINYIFLLLLPMCFRCYSNLEFPYTYNGKSGNWHLFLYYCRHFDKSFTEVFYQPHEFCPNHWFWLVAMATERIIFREKKYSKIFYSSTIWGMKLKLCIHVHDISLYINYVLYCCCPCAFIAMAT